MPSAIVSFGFKHVWQGHSLMPTDALLIDVRDVPGIRNPWPRTGLQALTGQDPAVQRYIAEGPGFHAAMAKIRDRVKDHPGPVWIGCHGGKHRSVYVAELLAAFFEVGVNHRDL